MTKQEFLAMSLPYGLKCEWTFYDEEEMGKENGIHIFDGCDYEIYSDGEIFDLKPILHPLSDLTKEIEHKGEKFVSMYELKKLRQGNQFNISQLGFYSLNYEMYYDIKLIPFEFIKKLIEWHFDIAGMIDRGEAIDVNTLSENPYK